MTNDFVIRPFESGDDQAVIKLWNDIFPDDPPWNRPENIIQTKLTVQSDLFFVCTHKLQLVGTVLVGFDGVRGWVHKLAVTTAFQKQGVASLLMKRAELELMQRGCVKLNIQVRASNSGVVEFYENLGYTIEDRISLGKKLNA